MEENEILENVETPVEENQDLANDSLAMAYDYYDRYYEQVLENMKTITDNQSTIIVQQENIIEQQKHVVSFCDCFILLFSIFFIYNYIRNMIILK